MNTRHQQHKDSGFTLIELMIVLSVIIILMAILLPQFMKIRYRAHFNVCQQYERNLAVALEQYRIEFVGSYPAEDNLRVIWERGYLSARPVCPTDSSRLDYGYTLDAQISRFTIYCKGVHLGANGRVRPVGYPQYSSVSGLVFGDE
jgi:prepilin-type N-terminal cleavage/methylation domain-containing protein